jgi:hypothetical protein
LPARGAALAVFVGASLLAAVLTIAGPENVAFPAGYRSYLGYWTVDRPINDTVRVFYASPDAAKAVKPGQPLPSGTVLTMEVYKAKTDGAGKPLKDASGRFVRGDLATVMVMEKRVGWGAEYSDDLRNGEWEYAQFAPDGTRSQSADSTPCLSCHRRMKGQDFVFTFPQLVAAPK